MHIPTLLVLLACGGPAEPPAPERVQAAAPEPVSSLSCPDGAAPRREAGAEGPEEYCDKGGVKHGPFVRSYPDGQRRVEGRYDNGQPDGSWVWWHAGEQRAQKGQYKGGKPVGNWTWWYESGGVEQEGDYLDGRKAGTWVRYYESGRKKEEGLYQHDAKDGPWTHFADDEANSVVRVETWRSGELQGGEQAASGG